MSNTDYIKFKQTIVAPSVANLPYRKPASAGTSRDSCGYWDSGERNALYEKNQIRTNFGLGLLYEQHFPHMKHLGSEHTLNSDMH